MGRTTPEMSKKIQEEYAKYPNYSAVAKKLGLDWKTIRTHVSAAPRQPDIRPAGSSIQAGASSKAALAYGMFQQGYDCLQVALELGEEGQVVEKWFSDYLRLTNLSELQAVYEETKGTGSLATLLELNRIMYDRVMTPEEFADDLDQLRDIRNRGDELERLENHIALAEADIHDTDNQLHETNRKLSEATKKLENADRTLKEKERRIQNTARQCQALELRKSALDQQIRNTDTTRLQQTVRQIVQREANSVVSSMQEQWQIALGAVVEFLQDEPQLIESIRYANLMGSPETQNRLAVSIVANYAVIIEKYHRRLAERVGLSRSAAAFRPVH